MNSRFFLRIVLCFFIVEISTLLSHGEELRMNQIQVIGTHNSYHVAPDMKKLEIMKSVVPDARAWEYNHAPLDTQLDRGVRNFEIDLYRFEEGYRAFHVPLYDMGSTCPQFVECLKVVRDWSLAHPRHVPISIILEIKQETTWISTEPTLPIDADGLDALDSEIRSVFNEEHLLTPDDVRGDFNTLEEAVLTEGWPLLDDARGKVFFWLHETGTFRDIYLNNRPSAEGRAMFPRSQPGEPCAAVIVADHPDASRIAELVKKGYWVRTRVDANLRYNLDRKEDAFRSGAHVLTTDFPKGEEDAETGYTVQFDGGAAARCNPVNTTESCTKIEE
jgi:hypothetical protein